jgi:hypothetical protein
MPLSDAESLVQYVRSLPDFVVYEDIGGNYNHIGATVADSVLQTNLRYETHVKPRVKRILAQYPQARTKSSVLRLLESIPATEFLSWRGEDRAERFSRVISHFASEAIETDADLREWLSDSANLQRLLLSKGIGPKTVDYFKIMVGVSTSAIDRHLLNFLRLDGLVSSDYLQAQAIINAAADILSIDRACFDHSIWQFMSKQGPPSCTVHCDGYRA